MTAGDVGEQLVKEIALIGDTIRAKIPEVMMGIADGELPCILSQITSSDAPCEWCSLLLRCPLA